MFQQYILESKTIKARKFEYLLKAINEYINARPSKIGELQSKGSWYSVKVDILHTVYVTATTQYRGENLSNVVSTTYTTFTGDTFSTTGNNFTY
jgi:hypothetical protein